MCNAELGKICGGLGIEIRWVGVAVVSLSFVFIIGQGAHDEGFGCRTQCVEDCMKVGILQYLISIGCSMWLDRAEIRHEEPAIEGVRDGERGVGDVCKAFGVGSVAVGINRDVEKVDGTSFGDASDKVAIAHGGEFNGRGMEASEASVVANGQADGSRLLQIGDPAFALMCKVKGCNVHVNRCRSGFLGPGADLCRN